MSDQHASVEEEIERALRLGLATGSQLADRYARARQELARQAQHRSEQEYRQLDARYRAEGASATARLALVDRAEWWDRAVPADITSMWQLAAQWQHEQSRAEVAAMTIARQVHDRYGVDVRTPGVDAETLRQTIARLDDEKRDRASQRRDFDDPAAAVEAVLRAELRDAALAVAAAEPQHVASVDEASRASQAPLLNLDADQRMQGAADGSAALTSSEERLLLSVDGLAHASLIVSDVPAAAAPATADGAPPYDSAERRKQTATRLRTAELPDDVVAVAMRADVAQARPATEAVTAVPSTRHGTATRGTTRGARRPDRSR